MSLTLDQFDFGSVWLWISLTLDQFDFGSVWLWISLTWKNGLSFVMRKWNRCLCHLVEITPGNLHHKIIADLTCCQWDRTKAFFMWASENSSLMFSDLQQSKQRRTIKYKRNICFWRNFGIYRFLKKNKKIGSMYPVVIQPARLLICENDLSFKLMLQIIWLRKYNPRSLNMAEQLFTKGRLCVFTWNV